MEDCVKNRKRIRDDSENDSFSDESKRVRDEPVVDSSECNRVEYSDVNKIRDDILDILEESDDVSEILDLDSVIKSFEDEIVPPSPVPVPKGSDNLGYLLEASDDELGLPPAISPTDEKPKDQSTDLGNYYPSHAFEFGENAGFENELPSYGLFEFGFGEEIEGNEDFVTVGGLFDYSDGLDLPESGRRPES
jgi:hypothetical protein